MNFKVLATMGLILAAGVSSAAPLNSGVATTIRGQKAVILPSPMLKKGVIIRENTATGVVSIIDANGTETIGRTATAADIQNVCFDPAGLPCGRGHGYVPGPDIVFQGGRAGYGAPVGVPRVIKRQRIDERIETPNAIIDRRITREKVIIDHYFSEDALHGAAPVGPGPEIVDEFN